MRIKASQIRQLAELFAPGERDRVTIGLKAIFPEAFAWKKLSPDQIQTEPYKFLNDEIGIHLFDKFGGEVDIHELGVRQRNVNIGVYRPGKGEQEFAVGGFCYRIVETLKDGCFSVWRCEE